MPHQATTAVALPASDGAVELFAQFEARSADNSFSFVSPTATLTVIKDTTPPSIVEARALGLLIDGEGRALSPSRTLAFAIDATDATSGVDAVGADFEVAPAVLSDVTAQPGLNRVQQQLVADRDGARDVVVVVEDRAGNRSAPVVLPVVVDTVPPQISLAVQGAAGGLLRSRVATVDVSSLLPGDDQLIVSVGLEGAVNESEALPLGAHTVVLPANFEHGAAVTFEAVARDVVGNRTSVTQTVVLDLRGGLIGGLVSDAVPGVISSVAGATLSLVDSRGAQVGGPVIVDASGSFSFAAVPEGRNYTLRTELAGHAPVTARAIAVDADTDTDLGDVFLALSRAEIRGRALRSDVVGDTAAHGGIAVTARLVSAGGRTFVDTVTTDASGAYALRAVPRTLAGEVIVVSAQAQDYGAASTEGDASDPVVTFSDLLLPRARGDFDVCRTADASCTPARFFRDDAVDVRLRDANDVVAVHVGVNGAAPERLTLGAGNRTTVSVAGLPEGEVVLAVQAEKSDGARSEVLQAAVIRDTLPPTGVAVVRRASAAARDPRFTAEAFLDVTVSADAGQGDVAPLANARAVIAVDVDSVVSDLLR